MTDEPGSSALPIGTELGEYVITEVIGAGGFSIVYGANEKKIGGRVAIKEYLPQSLAYRTEGNWVRPLSDRTAPTFEKARESFLKEASTLRRFRNPAILQVYAYWEANGTAYIVMPLYDGKTLKEHLAEVGYNPEEAWLRGVLGKLLDVLGILHAQSVWHRDIAPDNVLLQDDQPILLDFGAARRVVGEESQDLTVILKPGYAPLEQYATNDEMRQGPWTDLYALSATMYYAISGKAPIAAVARVQRDGMVPAAEVGRGRYSPELLHAIDCGLKVDPAQRTQSVVAYSALLGDSTVVPPSRLEATRVDESPLGGSPRGKLRPVLVSTALGICVLGAAAVAWHRYGADTRVAAAAPDAASAAPSAAGPPTLPEVAKTAPVDPGPAAVVAESMPAPKAAPREPFSISGVLHDIVQGADPSIVVSAVPVKSQVVVGQDHIQIGVRSSQGGYVYLLYSDTSEQTLQLAFPNQIDGKNRIEAGKSLSIPRNGAGSFTIDPQGPPGLDRFVVVVSASPRNFEPAGLKVASSGEIPGFDVGVLTTLWGRRSGSDKLAFVGDAVCSHGKACSLAYGASIVQITEVTR